MSANARRFILTNSFLYLIALIIALKVVDVVEIGAGQTPVGLAGVNGWFRRICHYNEGAGYSGSLRGFVLVLFGISMIVCLFWTVLFIRDMVNSGSLDGVGTDKNLMATFFLYILTLLICGLLRLLHINSGPVLLSKSAGAGTTFPAVPVLWIMIAMGSTVFHVLEIFAEKKKTRMTISTGCIVIAILGLACGALSGVYWLTDIVGALLTGTMLLSLYSFFFYI